MSLNSRQMRFVREYLIDANATQAAIRAGYSRKTAGAIGCENLKKPEIAEAIAASQREIATNLDITAERVLAELAKIGFATIGDYVRTEPDGAMFLDLEAVAQAQAAGLAHVTFEIVRDRQGRVTRRARCVKITVGDKVGALALLARHLGLFQPERQNSGPAGKVEFLCLPNADAPALAGTATR